MLSRLLLQVMVNLSGFCAADGGGDGGKGGDALL